MTDVEVTKSVIKSFGWSVVLLGKKSKKPVGQNWRITNAVKEIDAHIKSGGNIGIVCSPETVCVLDFDDLEAAKEMFTALGPLPIAVNTGSGKWHCYVKPEPGLNAKIMWRDKVVGECQRGPNQQVVAPPSIHPTGDPYTWNNPPINGLPSLPVAWKDYLTNKPITDIRKPNKPKPPLVDRVIEFERARAKAREVMERERPTPELILYRASEVSRQKPDKIFGGRLIRGAFQLMVGPGEAGKGMASVDLLSHFTTGEPFPGEEVPTERMNILACVTEDSKEVVSNRLLAAGADLDRVFFVEGPNTLRGGLIVPSPVAFDDDAGSLVVMAKKVNAGCIFLETTVEHLGDREGRNDVRTNNEYSVRRALSPIIALCREANMVGWGIMHPRKSMDGGIEDSISGSAAFRNAGRGVLHVYRDPLDETAQPWRLLVCSKANYLARRPPTLRFRIESWEKDPDEGRVVWGIPGRSLVDPRTAEDLWHEMRDRQKGERGARRDLKTEEAEKWLKEFLKDGMRPYDDITRFAEDEGHNWRSVERAKSNLGVVSVRSKTDNGPPKVIGWRLPNKDDQDILAIDDEGDM